MGAYEITYVIDKKSCQGIFCDKEVSEEELTMFIDEIQRLGYKEELGVGNRIRFTGIIRERTRKGYRRVKLDIIISPKKNPTTLDRT